MSQENVEIMRAGIEAWNAKDWDRLRAFYAADVTLRGTKEWPEQGPFLGLEAVMRQFAQMRDAWDADSLEPISEFIEAGDRVVVRLRWRGAGRGPELNVESTNVYTFRNQRIVFQEAFRNHAEALEAVGLSEQDAHADS
jgi:ketosteroid isomerase-like protein